jgi:hypothetical protein
LLVNGSGSALWGCFLLLSLSLSLLCSLLRLALRVAPWRCGVVCVLYRRLGQWTHNVHTQLTVSWRCQTLKYILQDSTNQLHYPLVVNLPVTTHYSEQTLTVVGKKFLQDPNMVHRGRWFWRVTLSASTVQKNYIDCLLSCQHLHL